MKHTNKKHGRPKGSKNKVKKIVLKKRGRGRPKGSKNKPKDAKTIKLAKIIKKSLTKSKKYKAYGSYKKLRSKEQITQVKFSKFLGYCSCGAIVAARDKRTPRTFICSTCGKKQQVNKLKTKNPKSTNATRPLNKKEYFESVQKW